MVRPTARPASVGLYGPASCAPDHEHAGRIKSTTPRRAWRDLSTDCRTAVSSVRLYSRLCLSHSARSRARSVVASEHGGASPAGQSFPQLVQSRVRGDAPLNSVTNITRHARASGRQHPAPAATAADTPATGAPARRCWHPRGPAAKPAPPHEAGWGLTLGCRRPVRRRHLHDGRCCFRAGLNLKSFRDGFGCGVRLRAQDKGVRAVPRQGLVRRTGADLCAFERRCHGRGDAWVTRARDGGSLQDCAQFTAAADAELAVDAVEMVVDGTDRDGKPVGDLGA
jgi:hypothetical protein